MNSDWPLKALRLLGEVVVPLVTSLMEHYLKNEALCFSSHNESVHLASLAISFGTDVNIRFSRFGKASALMLAAINGHLELVKLLLHCGAEVGLRDEKGFTALSYAAHNGHLQVVEVLLECGAEVNIQGELKCTPLFFAASNYHFNVVKMLLGCGAQPNLLDEEGHSPLFYALSDPHDGKCETDSQYKTVLALLDGKAEVNMKSKRGLTPIMIPLSSGNIKVAKILAEHGADLNILAEHDADLNAQNKDFVSVLMYCVRMEQLESVEFILESKNYGDINFQALVNIMQNALDIAIQSGNQAMISLLRSRGALPSNPGSSLSSVNLLPPAELTHSVTK